MPNVVLPAQPRQKTGSAESRRLRRGGRVPAVLYGRAGKAISLDLGAKEFVQLTKGISESTIVNVEADGKTYDVFVKNVQRNIIDGSIIHIDFYEVESGVVLRAKIAVIVRGNPVGVREGGIFENPTHEIEVECLPKDLPPRIEVDVSSLRANQSIHVRDIPLAESVKLVSNPDKVVALVKFAKAEAAGAAAEAAPVAAAAPAAGDKKS
ncbi:MAG: 50S ribosomal protein L25 [Spirochaetes bacterium]|nr:50S ribosomal protein L25 [Spirochaetota bacterium]